MKKILVTGGLGQLGSELKLCAEANPQFAFTFVDIQELDLVDEQKVKEFISSNKFNYIINCAAYTAVDKAEEETELCRKVNAMAVKFLAESAKSSNARLLHISTDYVFDGNFDKPIDESAKPNPVSMYGKTKLEGEQYLTSILDNGYIIRTAWVYSTFGKNFVKTILNLARQRSELSVVADQSGSPTHAGDLAKALLHIIKSIENGVDHPGTYHFSNDGVITWYDFAKYINDYFKLPCQIKPITTAEYKTLAVRPKYSVLDKSKIKKTFGVEIPEWKSSLNDCLSKLQP